MEYSLESLLEQVTIDRDTESEVETTVRKQARELVDRVHVPVKWRLSKTIKGRTLSGATGLFNDVIVVDLVLGMARGDNGRGED